MPEISIAISAASPAIDAKLRALARSAGLRMAAEGAKHDVLLFVADHSCVSQLIESASHRAKVCALWTGDHPSSSAILRILRAGVNGILPLEATAEQLKSAVEAMDRGLQVIDPAFTTGNSRAPQSPFPSEDLTDREQQVLTMMAEGLSNKEISSRLAISTHTVKFHISSILGKLGAASRTEAVTIGIKTGRVAI